MDIFYSKGASGSDTARYAAQLLDAARSVRLGSFQSAAALVMAMPSGLETRLRSVVGANVNRSAAGRAAFVITAAAGLFVVTICAVCQAQSEPSVKADARLIRITSKFVEAPVADVTARHPALKKAMDGTPVTLSDAEMQELMRQLAQKKGVDLMSAPSVTTLNGQQATVEVVREFVYPTEFEIADGHFAPTTFEMMPIGVIVELKPSIQSDGVIQIKPATAKVNEFLGFMIGGAENLKAAGKGRWKFDDTKKFVGRANMVPTSKDSWGINRVTEVTEKMKSTKQGEVKKGEVSKPVFSTKKWTGDVSLKPGEWVISCLKSDEDVGKNDARRIWFFVSAKEVKTTDAKPAPAAPKPAEEKTALQKARRIIFPQVQFNNAKLSKALEFLRTKSRELDPAREGINIILESGTPDESQITMILSDVPLNEALRYVVELADCKLRYDERTVRVRQKSRDEKDTEVGTSIYKVSVNLMRTEKDAKQWLEANGVVFPEDGKAVLDGAESKLVVKTTGRERAKVEAILEKLGVQVSFPNPPTPVIVRRALAPAAPAKIDVTGKTVEMDEATGVSTFTGSASATCPVFDVKAGKM